MGAGSTSENRNAVIPEEPGSSKRLFPSCLTRLLKSPDSEVSKLQQTGSRLHSSAQHSCIKNGRIP